jgi:hypothetical protein
MLLNRSGEERLKMGCSMHATARALAKAALSQKHPGAQPAELKRLLFLHIYGADFNPKQRSRIASALSKSARRSEAPQARVRNAFGPAKSESRAQVAERPSVYRTKRSVAKKK